MEILRTTLIILFLGCCCFSITSCAKLQPKDGISESADVKAEKGSGGEVDEARQSAEAAEWEAHRLREELFRKNKSKE